MRFLPIIIAVLVITALWWWRHDEIRYVPLGDSYTIGTSINPADNFPAQLTRDLNAHGFKVRLVTNSAHNGWTTQDLIDNELPIFDRSGATFTTLLIGVNDFNQGVPKETFQKNLRTILNHIKVPVVVLTIPDFTVTPTGKTFGDPAVNSAGIAAFNKIIKSEAAVQHLPVVDVFELSQDVASDGLHPSAKEYSLWEKLILPVALDVLKK